MKLSITPYTEEWTPAVRAMNQRLKDGGSTWGFYAQHTPSWLPRRDGDDQSVWQEYYVVADEATVRGGFVLKPQKFYHNGVAQWAASWQGPVSEGLVDKRMAMVGMLCLRDMQQKQPLLFCWGGSDKLLQLLDALGWSRAGTPLQICVLNAGNFLRQARVLRKSRKMSLALDVLAASGMAGLGLGLLGLLRSLRRTAARAKPVARLGVQGDEIWAAARDRYGFVGVRDAATVNAQLAHDGWPNGELFEVTAKGRTIGWGAIRVSEMSDNRRFGDMRVGSILDALALPGFEADVCGALTQELARRKPDMIMTHMTHTIWRAGLKRSGFMELANRRAFCATPNFTDAFGADLATFLDQAHLTPIDADGPHGL